MMILGTSCSSNTMGPKFYMGFLGGSLVNSPPANAGNMGSIHESGRSPGEGNGNTRVGTLTREIPWTEEPGGLQFMGAQAVRHDLATKQQQNLNSYI